MIFMFVTDIGIVHEILDVFAIFQYDSVVYLPAILVQDQLQEN